MIRCIRIGVWVKILHHERGELFVYLLLLFFYSYSTFPFSQNPFYSLVFLSTRTRTVCTQKKEKKKKEDKTMRDIEEKS